MKVTSLILIFSGLIGLNRCSDEVKINLNKFSNSNIEEIRDKKSENIKDTLSTPPFFIELLHSTVEQYKNNL